MLLETSGVGAVVDTEAIPVPGNLDLASWLKMYPGMGFVVTTKPENAEKVVSIFQRRGLTAAVIGQVTAEKQLVIRSGKDVAVLFDFEKECVTGI
jgi:selenophosphate synthetase-related protein